MDAIQPFLGWLQQHLLPVVLVVSVIDATGLPFPGRAVLVAAGMATNNQRDVVLLIIASVLGSLIGDHILYAVGMRQGQRLLALYCRLSLGSTRCVERTLKFFRRFGATAILICRFSTGVRLFAAVLAGSGEFSYRRFVALDVIGSLVYATIWIGLGAAFGAVVLERVGGPVQALLLLGPAALLGVLAFRLVRRWLFGPALRDKIKFTE